jgi:hypothetical protein
MTDLAVAAAEPPTFGSERLTDTGVASALQRLSDSGLIERGCATVIGLDAIRDRLAKKWESRRDWVWETAERHLQRRLGDTGFAVRLDDTDFVICAGTGPETSRAISLNLLRELLDFFLGSQRFEDMRMASVVWVRGEEIGCAPLDPRKIEPLPDEHPSFQPASPVVAPRRRQAWSILSFSTADGHGLELDLGFEPVINLRNGAPVATRLRPLALERDTRTASAGRWIERLTPADQTAVIEAVGETALSVYEDSEVGLVIPLSIYTIATSRNRALVTEKLQAVKLKPTKPVIIELTDVDPGTPQGRLLEAVSLVQPYCRAVIARMGETRPDVEILRAARLAGLSIDCTGLDGRDLIVRIGAAAQMGKVGSLLFAFGLPSSTACELAMAAGATHGGVIPTVEGSARKDH